MIGLLDCNNFYASCERIFNPKLRNKPVAVLSNNDGCIIARSQEVKAIGIPMGAPAHKYKNLLERYNVNIFSANFSLYGDISRRVMTLLSEYIPDIEIYSIDEAFLNFNIEGDIVEYAKEIVRQINKQVGIPVSIGIASTKTLAKVANHIAKKNKNLEGVCLMDKENAAKILNDLPVEEIWGIGWKTSAFLNSSGIYTVPQLINADRFWIKKNLGIVGERIILELQGIPCIQMDINPDIKKSIVSSRSFGKPIVHLNQMIEAVSTYATRAAEKLREDNGAAAHVGVSILTNRHKPNEPQYFNYYTITLEQPTFYTAEIIKAAVTALKQIYKSGYRYKKAYVTLSGIIPKEAIPETLFYHNEKLKEENNLMIVMDGLNKKYGSDFLKYASSGINQPWRMRSSQKSPQYTTRWSDLLVVG